MNEPELIDSIKRVIEFEDGDLTEQIFYLETQLQGADKNKVINICDTNHINFWLFHAASTVKDATRQINTIVHAVGILSLLPLILDNGEIIEYPSLGAGNSGKKFDLETNIRIAEFEFTDWQGRDSARQTSLFEDFYNLAEYNTSKSRCLYLYDTDLPKKFLNSKSAITSVLNKNRKLQDFKKYVGNRYNWVNEYYENRKEKVDLISITELWKENRDKI
jgi:hypothetical protein